MALFIQQDAGAVGAGSVFPDKATLDLIQISNNDGGYGENAAAPGSDLKQVTYAQSQAGACPNRLNTLVNTNFGVNAQNIDIIALGVDNTFILNDGTLISTAAGVTAPVGSGNNPTSSVMVIYDTSNDGGAGYCVRDQNSGNMDLQFPSPVILYHELSHALRFANGNPLSTSASGCAASPEENAAEVDENDMRDQLGIPHRDPTDHCGNPGCPTTCCIVASIASGSPYSAEVNALRQLRDRFLRGSEVGFDFFDRLHYDYYNFSPEVCRWMSGSGELRQLVELYFVKPLTLCLGLIHDYTLGGCDTEELGARFEAGLQAAPQLLVLGPEELRQVRALLAGDWSAQGIWADLGQLLNERAAASEPVRWALLATIGMYVDALEWRLQGLGTTELGERLARSIDQWGAQLPLTEVWGRLSQYALAEELGFLRRALLPRPAARRQFAQRLLDHAGGDPRFTRALDQTGFLLESNKQPG